MASTAIELVPPAPISSASAPSSPLPDLSASRDADSAAPEGGYGWAVVAGGAVLLWWSLGTTYAWGVVQTALVAGEGLASPATLAFVGSLQAALISALAVANSRAMRRLGARRTALLGAACIGASEILSSFAVKSLGGLFATSGVLMGVGVSLCFVVVSTIPAQYFSARRGLANGLMFAGSGFGGAAISFALDALIRRVGLAWAYRVLGLATLATGLPAAWAVKERVPMHKPGSIEWFAVLPFLVLSLVLTFRPLFRSPVFALVFAGSAVGTFPLFVAPFFIPLYADSLGFAPRVGAGLVAGFSLASALGRILSGAASDRLGPLNAVLASLVLTAVTMLAVWPVSAALPPLAVFVAVNGAANGAFFSTMPTVVSTLFGSARVAVAMSMIVTGWVGGYLMGAPIAGYILDAYGGAAGGLQAFRPAMFYAGGLAVVSGVLMTAARLRINKRIMARV